MWSHTSWVFCGTMAAIRASERGWHNIAEHPQMADSDWHMNLLTKSDESAIRMELVNPQRFEMVTGEFDRDELTAIGVDKSVKMKKMAKHLSDLSEKSPIRVTSNENAGAIDAILDCSLSDRNIQLKFTLYCKPMWHNYHLNPDQPSLLKELLSEERAKSKQLQRHLSDIAWESTDLKQENQLLCIQLKTSHNFWNIRHCVLRETVQQYQKQTQSLRKQLNQASNDRSHLEFKFKSANARIAELEQSHSKSQNELQETETFWGYWKSRALNFKEEIESLKKTNRDLHQTLEESKLQSQKALDEAIKELDSWKTKSRHLKEELMKRNNEIQCLKNEKCELKQKLNRSEKKIKGQKQLDAELRDMTRELNALKGELEESHGKCQEWQTASMDLRAKLRLANQGLNSWKSKAMDQTIEQLSDQLKSAHARIAELEKSQSQLQVESKETEEVWEFWKSRALNFKKEIESLKKTNRDLHQRLEESKLQSQERLDETKEELDSWKTKSNLSSKELAQQNDEIQCLKKENCELQENMVGFKKKIQDQKQLETELKRLQSESACKDSMQRELNTLREVKSQQQTQLSDLQRKMDEQNERLTSELSRKTSLLANKEAVLDHKKEEITNVQKKLDEANQALRKWETSEWLYSKSNTFQGCSFDSLRSCPCFGLTSPSLTLKNEEQGKHLRFAFTNDPICELNSMIRIKIVKSSQMDLAFGIAPQPSRADKTFHTPHGSVLWYTSIRDSPFKKGDLISMDARLTENGMLSKLIFHHNDHEWHIKDVPPAASHSRDFVFAVGMRDAGDEVQIQDCPPKAFHDLKSNQLLQLNDLQRRIDEQKERLTSELSTKTSLLANKEDEITKLRADAERDNHRIHSLRSELSESKSKGSELNELRNMERQQRTQLRNLQRRMDEQNERLTSELSRMTSLLESKEAALNLKQAKIVRLQEHAERDNQELHRLQNELGNFERQQRTQLKDLQQQSDLQKTEIDELRAELAQIPSEGRMFDHLKSSQCFALNSPSLTLRNPKFQDCMCFAFTNVPICELNSMIRFRIEKSSKMDLAFGVAPQPGPTEGNTRIPENSTLWFTQESSAIIKQGDIIAIHAEVRDNGRLWKLDFYRNDFEWTTRTVNRKGRFVFVVGMRDAGDELKIVH